jgi:hypothetical protein
MRRNRVGRYNGVNWKAQPIVDMFPHLHIKTVYVFEYDEDDKPTGSHFPTLKAFEEWADGLCCWCNETATGAIRYAGKDHAACADHLREYSEPIKYSNQDFDRINHTIR